MRTTPRGDQQLSSRNPAQRGDFTQTHTHCGDFVVIYPPSCSVKLCFTLLGSPFMSQSKPLPLIHSRTNTHTAIRLNEKRMCSTSECSCVSISLKCFAISFHFDFLLHICVRTVCPLDVFLYILYKDNYADKQDNILQRWSVHKISLIVCPTSSTVFIHGFHSFKQYFCSYFLTLTDPGCNKPE